MRGCTVALNRTFACAQASADDDGLVLECCGQKEQHRDKLVFCESCEKWLHCECEEVGWEEVHNSEEPYFCLQCEHDPDSS